MFQRNHWRALMTTRLELLMLVVMMIRNIVTMSHQIGNEYIEKCFYFCNHPKWRNFIAQEIPILLHCNQVLFRTICSTRVFSHRCHFYKLSKLISLYKWQTIKWHELKILTLLHHWNMTIHDWINKFSACIVDDAFNWCSTEWPEMDGFQ